MTDYLIAERLNGRLSFAILHDPGPKWRKRYAADQLLGAVELLASDGISLDDVRRLHQQRPDATLQALIDHWRLSREFGIKPR